MRNKLLFTLSLLLVMAGQGWAQLRQVTGQVTDATTGQGLPGVTLLVKGSQVGTSTDSRGHYALQVPAGSTAVIASFVGYVSSEQPLGATDDLHFVLYPDSRQLPEVIFVAYGTAEKKSLVGAVAQVHAREFTHRSLTNISSVLAGAAPGIQSTSGSGQPGAGPTIRIRGFGSVNASNDPLYVVDGVPYAGSIANLHQEDIETISVLKDAASAALYGARAANGVVLVTTKTGKKDSNQISVNASEGVSTRALPEYERVSAYQYYPLMWEAYRNSLVTANRTKEQASQIASGYVPTGANASGIKYLLGYNPFNVADDAIVRTDGTLNPNAELLYAGDLDWSKPLLRDGRRRDYSLTFAGGQEKTDYFVSMGYTKDNGFLIKSDYERITGRVKVNTQPKAWFKTGLNIAGTLTNSLQANAGRSTDFVNPFYFSRYMGPIYPVYAHDMSTGEYLLDAAGNRRYDFGNGAIAGQPTRPGSAFANRHVVAETEYNDNLFKRNALSGRTYGEVRFLNHFTFTTNLAVDITSFLASVYENKIIGDGAPAGRSSRTNTFITSTNLNQLLNYHRSLGKHRLDVLAGHENYDWTYNFLYGFKQGLVVEGNTELGNFSTTNALDSRTDKHRTEGYLSRLNYDFAGKYFFSASYRRDGSSKFASDVRWGNFYSLGAGWRLDQEAFFDGAANLDLLKLRASYGEMGNDGILFTSGANNYYPYQALYGLGYNNAEEPGFLQESLPNPNLVWEVNKNFDAGLDFELFGGRLGGSAAVFHRQSDNLLFNVPLPLSSGSFTITRNVGSMWNRGVELALSADIIRQQHFSWNVNANWTTVRNKITSLPQDEIIAGTRKLQAGKSLYEFWLRDYKGVDPADGAALYAAAAWNPANSRVVNGDSVTTEVNNAKFHYAGSAIPDFYGGLTNTVTYRDLSLSFLLNYQVGGKIYDGSYASLMSAGSYGAALHVDALQRWQQPGDVTEVPRLDGAQVTNFNAANSDRWLTSASYLSLRTAHLSYNLPAALRSRIHLQGARVFVSGENLYLRAARKGLDPTQSFNGTVVNGYTPARVVSLGLNLTL